MTNLLEKVLLTGFGIFVVVFFFSLINPFIIQIFETSDYYTSEIVPYLKVIDEVNYGIYYVQENNECRFSKTINYPDRLNITFYECFAKFEFFISSDIEYRMYEYDNSFYNHSYKLLPPKKYYLNISFEYNLIDILIY